MEFTKDDYVVEGKFNVCFVMYDLTESHYKSVLKIIVKPSWIIIEGQDTLTVMNRDKIICFSFREV